LAADVGHGATQEWSKLRNSTQIRPVNATGRRPSAELLFWSIPGLIPLGSRVQFSEHRLALYGKTNRGVRCESNPLAQMNPVEINHKYVVFQKMPFRKTPSQTNTWLWKLCVSGFVITLEPRGIRDFNYVLHD
jgi:hypothetical protein